MANSRFRSIVLVSFIVLALTLTFSSISCSSSSTGNSSQETPTADNGPVISIAPTSGGAGTQIEVKGRNWEKGEKVVVSIGRPNSDTAGAFGGTVVKEDGSFETSFALPAIVHRGDQLVLMAHTSDYQLKAMASFQVTK